MYSTFLSASCLSRSENWYGTWVLVGAGCHQAFCGLYWNSQNIGSSRPNCMMKKVLSSSQCLNYLSVCTLHLHVFCISDEWSEFWRFPSRSISWQCIWTRCEFLLNLSSYTWLFVWKIMSSCGSLLYRLLNGICESMEFIFTMLC